jgi:glycogen synthase
MPAPVASSRHPMHLLWLTENHPPQCGGMAVSCDRIVRTLRKSGVRIDVAHFSARHQAFHTSVRQGGHEFSCPVGDDVEHALNRAWTFVGEDRAGTYTHVVAFGGVLPLLAGPVFAAWLRCPLVTLIRGNDFDAGIFSLRRGDILRTALQASAAVAAVSQDKVDKIAALFPATRVVWTPNGIDLADWQLHPHDHDRAAAWRAAHVAPGRRVLGLVGQLKRKKGGLFFLDALLRSGHAAAFHLLLVGDMESEMSSWLDAHRAEIAFTTVPFLDRFELLPRYAACDLVVIPSFYDGTPNVLLESASLGVPILAARTGGMSDLLAEPGHALLFRAGDETDCIAALDRAARLTDVDLRAMGSRARDHLRASCEHHAEAARYLQLLETTRHPAPLLP